MPSSGSQPVSRVSLPWSQQMTGVSLGRMRVGSCTTGTAHFAMPTSLSSTSCALQVTPEPTLYTSPGRPLSAIRR